MSLVVTREDAAGLRIENSSGFGGYTLETLQELYGITETGRPPLFVKFRGDTFLVNAYSRPLVRHLADRAWVPAGIAPPKDKLAVVAGSGSGGSSGDALCFVTFLHKQGGRVLAESSRSNIVSLSVSGEGFDWSNIQSSNADFRVNTVRGYRSMGGADYRMAWEAPYGISSISENRTTARLSFRGPDPDTQLPPPVGVRLAHVFSNRMFWANSPEFPYRLWYSPAGKPQYTSKLGFRDTPDRETVNAIWRGRNELLVFCEDSCYKARVFGSGADDIVLEKLDSDVGCITQRGILEIFNRVWFPSRDGYWVYDGQFHYISKLIYPMWNADFKSNESSFRNGWAIHDRERKVMMFVTGRPSATEWENTGLSPKTVRYVAYYGDWERGLLGEQPQPDWSLDMLARQESSGYSNDKGEVYFGSCDGVVRKQDDTDADDDSDTILKTLIIRTGHQLFFEPGDDVMSGKEIVQHWHHVESENNAWTLYILGGDEDAWRQIRPDNSIYFWKADVPASLLNENQTIGATTYDVTYCAKSVHFFEPEQTAGRGFTFEIKAASPLGFKYRGFGGQWARGHASRRWQQATIVP